MACGCAQKSKQKFAVINADGSQRQVFDTYQQAQIESRKNGGKIRVVNGAG